MEDFSLTDQLKKYASDLARVYKSEKQRRNELAATSKQLLQYARDLNHTISDLKFKNIELREAYLDTIHRLVRAAEFKDEDTGDHIVRISKYTALLAEKTGASFLDIQSIIYAAPMHDIGKIGIPDHILFKRGKLSKEEFEIMKTHTIIGAAILANSKAETLQIGETIAMSHHEKWNGSGYPKGLKGEEIPLLGRIVGLVDVFDALTSKRPYKNPYPVEVACEIIQRDKGSHFDPQLVDLFMENISTIIEIKGEFGSIEDLSVKNFSWSERDLEDMKDQPIINPSQG
jgi:putative two-component system response regulator